MDYRTSPAAKLKGTLAMPGDKSISHRALILAAIAEGKSRIKGFLESDDCLNTMKAFQAMGVNIEKKDKDIYEVDGVGLKGLQEAGDIIDCGNSGTTMRLLAGLLAAQDFYTVLTGDNNLRRRPMDRVIEPLSLMGAEIWARGNKYAPISILGRPLQAIEYKLPVASAQVKSALLLAGLYCDGELKIIDKGTSRDHTERMLISFGVELDIQGNIIMIKKKEDIVLKGQEIDVPGDISSAAYFIAAALLTEGSELILTDIGINPTRSGFLEVIKEMGAELEIFNIRNTGAEPLADIRVSSSKLKAVTIKGEIIPTLVDELPLLAILAARAEGVTIIQDAGELRVKESDRIKSTVQGLMRLGVKAEEKDDGMIIYGPGDFCGNTEIDTFHDHRIAMSFAVAGLISKEPFIIKDFESVNISFPEFNSFLAEII